jgi:hemolysin activation/secretion protein
MTSFSLSRYPLTPLALALLCMSAQAQVTAPVGTPDAGSLLQQMQPAIPAAPSSDRPALQITPAESANLPASLPFEVKQIRIIGNTVFSTEELHALIAHQEGKQLTLSQLEALATVITAYYQERTYPLARAIIPAQTIKDGVVIIQVVEARYGAVQLNNSSRVRDSLLNATLSSLTNGAQITSKELDHALLLLSDVPGVTVNAVLKPGTEVGTSDLDVTTTTRAASFATVSVDHYGNPYIGRERLGGTLSFLNPLRSGDTLNVNFVTTGDGMNYGRIGYDILLNGAGTRAGVAYSAMCYKLGSSARALDANGTASIASVWVKHPLLRSRQANIYTQLQYEAKQLRDHIDVSDTRTDRHLNNWIVSLNGDWRDNFLSAGVTMWNFSVTHGRVAFKDQTASMFDAISAQTRGEFSKAMLNVSRIQALTHRDNVHLNMSAQWADSNLDSAEKMSVGGPYSVRAYDIGALSADTGYFGSIEWRHNLGQFAAGRLQTTAFVESARVKLNHRPWTTSNNSATLSGAGLGLLWEGPNLWRATASVATRIGAVPSMVAPQSSARAWVTMSKAF